ncbi:MAG: phosphoserine phosphatase SerB [Sporichthyaceae bacterium]|nr:phosphoserine phosphatase SerB [Sporichthyaceae bacterium]
MHAETHPATWPVRTLLLTVTGRDRPGVTSALFDVLAEYPIQVLDMEQVVVRGRLILGVLVTSPNEEGELSARLTRAARELGMDIETIAGAGDNAPRGLGRLHVTMLGQPLRPVDVAAVAGIIAGCGANIDRIVRLSRNPVTSLELDVSGADSMELRRKLTEEAARREVDVAVQRSGLYRRAKRLVVMDVDSTLVRGEMIDALGGLAGSADEVARITAAAMRGDLDYTESLRRRVELLAGLDASALDEVTKRVELTPGAATLIRTLKRLDHKVAVVSGGFTQVTDVLAAELGLDYAAANTLEIVDGRLTGRLTGPIIDRAGKADALRRFAAAAEVPLSQTVAIGDGANDLDMIALAGLGVAFNAKAVVKRAADTSVSMQQLDAILFLLGISKDEIDAEDDEVG